jgi:hypothetical protein
MSNNVTSIGERAFGYNLLKNVIISDKVEGLNESVFTGSLVNLSQISMGANIDLTADSSGREMKGFYDTASDVVWNNLKGFYEQNGKKAGIYTLNSGKWSVRPK